MKIKDIETLAFACSSDMLLSYVPISSPLSIYSLWFQGNWPVMIYDSQIYNSIKFQMYTQIST